MALVSLQNQMLWPGNGCAGLPTLQSFVTVDAAGEYGGIAVLALEDMTISHVGLKCNAVAGSPTADIRIETIDTATGLPTGTLWGTDTNIITATLTTSWAVHALTASASITQGQFFFVKVAYNSGTSFAISQFTNVSTLGGAYSTNIPYGATNTGVAAAVQLNQSLNIGLGSSSTSFYMVPQLTTADTLTTTNFNNSGGDTRRGLRFQVPFKCRVAGLSVFLDNEDADFYVALYDDAGNELSSSSTAFDTDVASGGNRVMYRTQFDNKVTLSPATWYRAVVGANSASNTSVSTLRAGGNVDTVRSGMPGGTNVHLTTFASGSWTDTATAEVPIIDLMIDQLDDGVSAGSRAYGIQPIERGI